MCLSNRLILALMAVAIILLYNYTPSQANAGLPSSLYDPYSIQWSSVRNYTSSGFNDYFSQKSSEGFMVADLDILEIGGDQRVSAVWQKNVDGRGWASWRNLTSTEFNTKWTDYREQNYRLIDQEAYVLNGDLYFAGVWIENVENLTWVSYRNVDSAEFSSRLATYKDQGYIPTDVEAYEYNGSMYYSAIMVDNVEGLPWALWRNMSSTDFNNRLSQYSSGYRVLDVESYENSGSQDYAAIWIGNPSGRSYQVWRDLTSKAFGEHWRDLIDQGYRLIDQDVYHTASGVRYASVWRQNSGRPDWVYKNHVDTVAVNAMQADNIPGMAIGVARDGVIHYRRGYGEADIASQTPVSSWTIFRLASVAKAVAGVMALDLDEGGWIKLDNGIQTYVPELADDHTYTVADTITNRSLLGHYDELGSPADDAHFNSALSALGHWNYFIGMDDEFGTPNPPDSNYLYSTHAYTVLGAALEDATNIDIDTLVNNWATSYGLDTLKAENRSSSNTHRATLYDTGNNEISNPDDLSWKRLGGGMESNIIDLTRFGILLMDGQILTEGSRQTLWTDPDGTFPYGYGWDLGTEDCLEVYGKRGTQDGGRAYIRVYPEIELVVTVLTNSKGAHDPRAIGRSIAAPMVDDYCATVTPTPSPEPTEDPTAQPTDTPTTEPTDNPTTEPTAEPTEDPTAQPTDDPTVEPTTQPTTEPTDDPTVEPTTTPGLSRINPADGSVISAPGQYTTRFQWAPVPDAAWYHVYIATADYSTVILDQWYEAADVCDSSVCTTPMDKWIGNGNYIWWMTYWNAEIGPAHQDLYNATTFAVNMPMPSNVEGIAPSGEMNGGSMQLQWNAEPNALWYEIWVGPADYSATMANQWVNGATACQDGLCTFTLSASMSNGDYEFWLRPWNAAGMTNWQQMTSFSVTP